MLSSFCNRICITHTDLLICKYLITLLTADYAMYCSTHSLQVPDTLYMCNSTAHSFYQQQMSNCNHSVQYEAFTTGENDETLDDLPHQFELSPCSNAARHDHSITNIFVYDRNLHFLHCGPQLYRGTSTHVSTVAILNYL